MASWYDSVSAPMDANGCVVPMDTKELVYEGTTREVYGLAYITRLAIWRVGFMDDVFTNLSACIMPDSWEMLEEDANLGCRDYCEKYRLEECDYNKRVHMLARAKALSGLREGRKDMPKAMVSQPMAGETDEQIAAARERATAKLEAMGYEVVDTLFTEEAVDGRGVVQVPLRFLAKSLESMSLCRAAYFCKGWENARGCRIEHDAAVAYGLEVLYED